MSRPTASSTDMRDLTMFLKFFCLKSAQIIIQGRLGKLVSSKCSPIPNREQWFNLTINDHPQILKEAKTALKDGNPNFNSSFVVEISLRTHDSERLVLEVWSVDMTNKLEDHSIRRVVYNRMSLMLKSLMCISRATPAYKLSQKKGRDYVVYFKIYSGKTDLQGLGSGCKTLRVGSVGTPGGTISVSVTYRSHENLHISTKKLVSGERPMKVSIDHFCSPSSAAVTDAKPCYTLQSGILSSQSSCGSMESGTGGLLPSSFSISPNEQYLESPRQRTAIFTVGTPPTPTPSSFGKTPPQNHLFSRRKMSDISFNQERRHVQVNKTNNSFNHSQSEQAFSSPLQEDYMHRRFSNRALFEDTRHSRRRNTSECLENYSPDCQRVDSKHSTLTNENGTFLPISCSPSDLSVNNHSRTSSTNTVMALKSNSPTNARVGFPDNTAVTSHLSHVPPTLDSLEAIESPRPPLELRKYLLLPSPGAFVTNSKSAKRAFESLNAIPSDEMLPFNDLIACKGIETEVDSGKPDYSGSGASRDDDLRSVNPPRRLSSQSSQSSTGSNHSSPVNCASPDRKSKIEEFHMIELNPAFVRTDSAKDLCAFYKEFEKPADLKMFQENNGQETFETFLDLTKQLEDYERDAADFNEFLQELETLY